MLRETIYRPSRSPRLGSPKGKVYSQNKQSVKGLNFSLFSPNQKKKEKIASSENTIPTSTSLENDLKNQAQLEVLSNKLKMAHQGYRKELSDISETNDQKYNCCLDLIEDLKRIHHEKMEKKRKQLKEVKKETQEIQRQMKQYPQIREKILKQNYQLQKLQRQLLMRMKEADSHQQGKEKMLMEMQREIFSLKEEIQYFERLQIKQKKRIKQLQSLLEQKQRKTNNSQ